MFLTSEVDHRIEEHQTSHLNVPDLERHCTGLWTDDVILSGLSHLSLQGLKLTVNVRKLSPSWSTTLHLIPPEDTKGFTNTPEKTTHMLRINRSCAVRLVNPLLTHSVASAQ